MYRKILELTREIEKILAADDLAQLSELVARRAEAFGDLEENGKIVTPEMAEAIEQIRQCEERCKARATLKLDLLKKDREGIRRGRMLDKAYGVYAES